MTGDEEKQEGTVNSADEDDEDLFNAEDDEDEALLPTETPDANGEGRPPPAASELENATKADAKEDMTLSKRIPRISAPAPAPAPTPAAPLVVKPGSNANKYGLPEEINIPASVTPSILNGRLLETLRTLPNNLINDAMAEYDDAVGVKGESIRNPGAYLWGVIKRYISVNERATSGEGLAVLPMSPELTPAVNDRLARLVSDGFCTQEEMNDKVKSKIRMLSETDALFAIEELASVDRTQIRTFGSYFMGILNRYMRGERKDLTSGKKTLAEVRQEFMSPHSNRQDDRKRGRDSEPPYRRGRDDSFRQQGQRDRNDTGRRDSRDFQEPYGHQQQNRPPYGGAPPMMSPPQTTPRLQQGGSNQFQHQQPQPYGHNPYGPQQGPPPHQTMPPQQYAPPPLGGPPNQFGNQPMLQQAGYGQPPPNQYGPPQNLVSHNPYGNLQQQQQPGGVPGLPPHSNSYGMPQNQPAYMNQQQQQHHHQQQESYSNPPFSSPPAQQNTYSQQAGPPNQWGNLAPPQSPLPPMDIMALADKASSAVQALQNQNKFLGAMPQQPAYQQPPPYQQQQQQQQQQPYGQPPMNVPPSYPPGNHPYPPQQGYGLGAPAQKKRRTTASLIELPVNVQFAVQNLQATGQTGPLDDGMLGMIKDLPEDMALIALQKFAALDKSSMRNVTAYLAGLLRRELEKINRR